MSFHTESNLKDAVDLIFSHYDKDKNNTLDKKEVIKAIREKLGGKMNID